jgi:hypothetical protein
MPKKYPSQALTDSYRAKQSQIRMIGALLSAAGLVIVSLYAHTFLSLSPADAAVSNALGAVGGLTAITLGVVWFKRAVNTLNAQ